MGSDVTSYFRTERHQVPAVVAGLVAHVTLKRTAFAAALLTQSWHDGGHEACPPRVPRITSGSLLA